MNKYITPRTENFAQWYQDIIKEADMAEHSAVRGCMIIKPHGYALWERIQKILDQMIKNTGSKNVYFPLLMPLSFLEKEAEHIQGFAKECAVVTHHRLEVNHAGKLVPSPDAILQEPLVIRPTSEAIIGDAMSRWVQSYKDLPIVINQWCNVMRWEMRTRLFLRTSEFLWQEGHTAHVSCEEGMEKSLHMLDVYENLAVNYLAIPVIKGEKTPSERFPGAINTFTIEAMMQDGKALQAGTSHLLGQNFSKAYDIAFTDKDQTMQHVWNTSWGLSTRIIGAIIMVHSDDEGLVLPPHIAPDQIVIIPVVKNEETASSILDYCDKVKQGLEIISYNNENIRVTVDKGHKKPTEKFWEAVKKGIPLRIEIGQREIESGMVVLSQRDKPAKERKSFSMEELIHHTPIILKDMQENMLEKARDLRKERTFPVHSLDALKEFFNDTEKEQSGFALVYFDATTENEDLIKDTLKELKITARCIPFDTNEKEGQCILSRKMTQQRVIFARAY